MNENERNTHFRNAAKLLSEKLSALYLSKGLDAILGDPNGEIKQQEILLFSQFGYDLVYHSLDHETIEAEDMTPAEVIRRCIPDMTEWPKH